MSNDTLENLLREERRFPPSPEFAAQAVAQAGLYDEAATDRLAFWDRQARALTWATPWAQTLDWSEAPFARWFVGGTLNVAYNCVDRHVEAGHGDRVAISLPMIPEAAIAMLACARIGAPHSVVFGGFSAEALRSRIDDAEAKVVVTADGGYRRGAPAALKPAVDEAVKNTLSVTNVLVVRRTGQDVAWDSGRDVWWHEALEAASDQHTPEPMDAEHPLFILYTSGTTGKPKGILHTSGGYLPQCAYTHRNVFDLHPETDVYWCTADVGWVTGHSYVVYGPLANGATQVMYEGTPDTPKPGRWWELVQKYGVTILYTAPTAIRTFMKWGEETPGQFDLSSLRVPGIVAEVVDDEGKVVPNGGGGYLVLTEPWPSMLRGIWGDPQRYKDTYWSRFPNRYFAGDGAKKDDDGDIWLLGRVDDVMNVSGHRLSTTEIESALVSHPKVAEAAVVGAKDEDTGQAVCAFVILRESAGDGGKDIVEELRAHVAKEIGKIARPRQIMVVPELPKTRSGKIMRRLLRDIAEKSEVGDVTTLADSTVMDLISKGLATSSED